MYPPPSWKPPGAKSTKKTGSGHSAAVMATTRAATFSAKIRTLSDFHSRILNQQQVPSSAEMVTTLRYFQQTLVSFLKDIPSERSSLFEKYSSENAIVRSGLYPNLNYSGLFYGIVNLLDAFPMISSAQTAIAEAILDTLKALYFFLDRECIEQLPLLLASQLGVFPSEVDRRLVHLLCDCIFPYSFGEGVNGRVSVPAVLILVLHHSADNSLHTLIIERLAYRLPDLYSDLLTVIASGTSESRIAAVNLLFHYWPLLYPGIMLRRTVQYRVQAWSSPQCQNTQCVEKGPSTCFTYEPSICANLGDSAPPMFICHNCNESVTSSTTEPLHYLSQPLPGCNSSNRIATGACFDEDCIRSNGHVPLRLCEECFNALHPVENIRAYEHNRHSGHGSVWGTPYERVMVEAIVKLLRETSSKLTELSADGESAKRPKWLRQLEGGRELGREIDPLSDERRMLSRFGIWLMVAHCPPTPEATPSSVGYLLGALFQWFSTTALLPNDAMGQTLEQLKADFGCDWLNQALSSHYEVFINELLPQQLEPLYGNIEDTIWDERFVRKEIMRDGLSKLLALAPYDIISITTWSRVMPHWLHSLNNDLVSEEDLLELKVPISKLFEPDLCALSFEPQRLYEFLAIRLQSNSYEEILKALDWLHLLSRIDIRISLELLLEMFSNSLRQIPLPTSGELLIQQKQLQHRDNESKPVDGVNSGLASPGSRENKIVEEEEPENAESSQQTLEGPMAAQLVMTDILAQQIKLAGGASAMTSVSLLEYLFSLIAALLEYQPEERFTENGWTHTCKDPEGDQFADCLRCQQALFLYQVLLQVLEQFCPKEESRLDALNYGDETARDFADWLSEASSSVHQQQPQGVVADGNSPRPSPSPLALSSYPAGHSFFGSPITQKRQQQQPVQKTSTPLIKARQEVSTPSAEMVGALPTDDVDSASEQVAAFSFAEQSPMGVACISATVIGGLLQQQEAILTEKNGSEAVDGEGKIKIGKTEQKEEQRIFWETSVGRFRFSLEQLPAQLRLTYVLLKNIEREPDPDVQFFLLSMLKYLFLHRECLLNARKEQEHRGFLVWIQENLLIPRLWSLLRSDYSHVGQMATPLLLHAITLPLGDDVFWESVNAEFTSSEWERRLKAVDRVLVLAHFVPPAAVRSNRTLLTSLSCAFSHLIVSVHDPNPAVAQKALLLLEALPRSSLTLICHCLEAQFDSCILDRPLIIARIHLLSVLLPEENLLSWDFFIQRFETLSLEAHLKAQQNAGADASMHFLQDLLHSDPMSDIYQRKVTRARQSLNEADNVRSIVRSLREHSLRHQLNPGVRGDQERRDAAQQVLRVCLRRGAVAGTTEKIHGRSARDLARLRLRKVLVVIRVVSAWREMAGRLLLPSSRRSSKMSHQSGGKDEGEFLAEEQQQQQQSLLLPHHQHLLELADQGLVEDMGFSERYFTVARRSIQSTPPLLLPTLPQSRAGSTTSSLALDLAHPLVQSTVSASSLSPKAIGSDSRYGRMREFTDEESNLCLLLNRVVDMQNPERHTVSLVVSLFVHFLASKRCGPADNAKKLSVLLRHFNTLLGYSNSEKCFTIPPARLRRAAVCNAFLHGLPGVLDSNLLIGNQLLSIVLQLLLYLPSPQKFASDAPSADYSLRLLSTQQRHNWLHSIIIILYKYRCDAAPTNDAIRKQMLIVVQTLEQQCHRCPPSSQNQEQQPPLAIAPENKERRSATCLLEAPGPDGQWSSSTEDSEVGNDSG
uniref:Uncoordinated protein 79 n=1 Tax=Meloidogyne incognita TaxID=6306 RepID=A0A914MJ01_MELIC